MPKHNPIARDDRFAEFENEDLPIYVLDLETDPFKHDDVPQPFVAGFYDGETFTYRWHEKFCIRQMGKFLETVPPGIIFVHNGGRFDFFYTMEWFDGKMMLINGRIVRTESKMGHEFRDSFAIMPFALKQYKKDDIDYDKLSKLRRNANRDEILAYLKSDCVYLWQLCTDFISTFGNNITIGSTAMKELKKVHTFEVLPENIDEEIRTTYYYGGRVQCFKKGIINKPLKVYDVNSMYPFAMMNYRHPIGRPNFVGNTIRASTCFVTAKGTNHNAFPQREKDGSLNFDTKEGTFTVSIHEWRVAIKHGLFTDYKIIETLDFDEQTTFKKFVDKFYNLRRKAKETKDDSRALFYKFVLNSAYGKFAQNPKNYYDYKITPSDTLCTGWVPDFVVDDSYTIWKQKSKRFVRHNVATAASITGAARAVLLEAIANAKGIVYCDTDSIICESLSGVQFDDASLGAWKLEATGNRAAIGGKKLYAIYETRKAEVKKMLAKDPDMKSHLQKDGSLCLKQANKGVKLTPDEIMDICNGKTVLYEKDSPTYKWDGTASFIQRKVRMLDSSSLDLTGLKKV